MTALTPTPLPAQTAAASGPGGSSQSFLAGSDLNGDWWTFFRSPELDRLVAQAVKANPDLAAAKAALRAAHETYLAQRGILFPSLGADYAVSRQKANDTLAPPLADSNNLFTLHTASLTISYAADVFGGARRQVESAAALAEAQKWQTEAAYLTLTSSVVTGAIQAAALSQEITATERVVVLARESLDVVRRQKTEGQAAGLDVAAQESALASAEAALPPLRRALAAQTDQLAQLTGRFPGEMSDTPISLDALTLPTDLPVRLPSQIVAQRPDILAASANLHNASALVGVAIAARLPAITLTGQVGGASTALSSLFTAQNSFYSVAGDIAQPIFQGGALYHRQKAAEATLDEAKAQYRSTVLSAFQNVADTLQALHADAAGLAAAVRAEDAAKSVFEITRRQQETGQVAGLAVMQAEEAYQQALIARIQTQAARYADTVALYQALGGGWWNRKVS
jgi:NodT family efflux transporter outer membrane factor (OMF) lipoprotein